jgi:hypothetical protein
MPPFFYAPPQLDWLEMTWTGGYDEEEWQTVFLPIYGPVNQDGVTLGFLLVTE